MIPSLSTTLTNPKNCNEIIISLQRLWFIIAAYNPGNSPD
jgi:hypothetical protein